MGAEPSGAREVRIMGPTSVFFFPHRIDAKHETRDFPPISPRSLRIEEAHVGHEMRAVIRRQFLVDGRDIRDLGCWLRCSQGAPTPSGRTGIVSVRPEL